jgi:MFS family permease
MSTDSAAELPAREAVAIAAPKLARSRVVLTVMLASLGYFVDIFDLSIFGIVRIASLRALGLEGEQLLEVGRLLINMQMIGMLVGGLFWGVIGDRRGRVPVLLGSILVYSLANLANAYVGSVEAYALLRLVAGFGLAGELGASITLVSEVLPKETRGVGTTIVATMGILGGIASTLVGESFEWQTTYLIGGCLGLLLLAARLLLLDASMSGPTHAGHGVRVGRLGMLFTSRERFARYMACTLIGVPIWFALGVLVPFSPELARELGVAGTISAGQAILYCSIGVAAGDFVSGLLSQYLRSRRKVVGLFLALMAATTGLLLSGRPHAPSTYYLLCFALGFGAGFWAVLVTVAAEQFGTNLRATVATSVPNLVRGAVVPLSLVTSLLRPSLGLVHATLVVGIFAFLVAVWALLRLEETFGRDLAFVET